MILATEKHRDTTTERYDRFQQGDFLKQLASLQPDLCITAAYGNILPQRFLDIPRFGTLNIHPSLLPKYRGASPVQRAVQACHCPYNLSEAQPLSCCTGSYLLIICSGSRLAGCP